MVLCLPGKQTLSWGFRELFRGKGFVGWLFLRLTRGFMLHHVMYCRSLLMILAHCGGGQQQ